MKGCLTGLLNSQETAEKRVLVNSQRTKDERKSAHGSYGGHYTAREACQSFLCYRDLDEIAIGHGIYVNMSVDVATKN